MTGKEYQFLIQTHKKDPGVLHIKRNGHLELVKEATDTDPFVIHRRKHLEIVFFISCYKYLEVHAVY